MNLTNETIDLRLAQHYQSRMYDVHECYYFEIFKHNDNEKIGYIDIRIGESEYLFFLGNIGYRIDEPFRGNGYAYQACQLVMPLIYNFGLKEMTITTDPGNEASRKTIEKLKGEFLGVIDIPRKNPLYTKYCKKKLVYKFDLEKMYG